MLAFKHVQNKSLITLALENLNPFKGDPTAVFINYASVFVVFYGLKNFIVPHHPHQDVIYPYMKSKRRTLAFMFEKQ
ncbi:hypothetical protein DDB_G0274549 [Dictyostelium discoideum AX4]|uniref:Uncharacterized protein n=1 Tax=Dictyostelium discoideum TaxID=44689 RepID=Q8MP23_DICDI|nr:hypothetical protein DDB_G0274549 [Dictyostelium discoideum AX4]AAM44374.1 hypothetical protein [Dictyostelium discoideum]EAL70167.1 hypothetical protein DDB_G0274549 [Dictyostelium discoideum AX4]|eukprot:XP_644042.1 hypothetical protein DDB_G0274549 [Dictyostelium discoideum AX4]